MRPAARRHSVRHIASGSLVFVVKGDGSVVGWGRESFGLAARQPSASERVTAPIAIDLRVKVVRMAVGRSAAYALLEDARVVSWGANGSGQLGNGGPGSRSTPGINPKPAFRPVAVTGLTDIVQIDAGGNHALALRRDGTVFAWGSAGAIIAEETVQRGVATGPARIACLENIARMSAAVDHNQALGRDGRVWAWGENKTGQLGLETTNYRSARPVVVPAWAARSPSRREEAGKRRSQAPSWKMAQCGCGAAIVPPRQASDARRARIATRIPDLWW